MNINGNDRDNYVTINFTNVPDGLYNIILVKLILIISPGIQENLFAHPAQKSNFDLTPLSTTNDVGVAYDYGSIMHYENTAFSNSSGWTIIPKDGSVIKHGSERPWLSANDVQAIQLNYASECAARDGLPTSTSTSTSTTTTTTTTSTTPRTTTQTSIGKLTSLFSFVRNVFNGNGLRQLVGRG
jgi:hypothetical protein